MKSIISLTTAIALTLGFISCGQKLKTKKTLVPQAFIKHEPSSHHKIALEVLNASKVWISHFNTGNVEACLEGYHKKAVMSATPFGTKIGIKEISEFWTPFVQSGATNLIYTNVSIEVANKTTAFLSANWSMNIGKGAIYKEKWEKKEGKWLLTYDNFEVLEQFKETQKNDINPIASHVLLENVIQTSSNWIKNFNSGKGNSCGNGYSENATMNAVPFALINGKKDIESFWTKLIKDGAKNLTYHNPIFKVNTNNSVSLSSQWSMNIGEGKIYEEKWEKINDNWLLTYDEFQVLKQY